MSAVEELVHKHPWWDLAELILWVGTRDPMTIARGRTIFDDEQRWERTLDELRKGAAYDWWVSARQVILAGGLEVTYVADGGPRKIEAHEAPHLEFMFVLLQSSSSDDPFLYWNGPYLCWKNDLWGPSRLNNALVKAADIVKAFPPQEPPALAAPQKGQRGPASSMPAIRKELEKWIEGGHKRIVEELKRWTPTERTSSLLRLARALAAWASANGGKETKPGKIEKELRPRLHEAYKLI
jgi:hypothetical protein